ncbi:MAG: methionine--tRNA ligase [Spirochaetales bacterium]
MQKRRLVTSALPYVNNIPHLGNLIQVLSADVFSRYSRQAGFETLYICGTDEYGTATETKALEEGVSPKELCDRFHIIHRDIYQWFGIAFDKFGRTSDREQTEITQQMFLDLDAHGFILEQTIEQMYLPSKSMFLADRYVRGVCPSCGYKEARGDQCEHCGKLLDPTELLEPWTPLAPGEKLVLRPTKHLYIDLPKLKDKLEAWIAEASERGSWARNAVKMTEAWIRDGLKPRAITRDLKWGIPVPKPGWENKVFYVWFDAPIGYISMTASLRPGDWKTWWQNPQNVELYQFIGKDNIPFHTVVFPSSLLGSGRDWTMLHTMSSSEYLNYESGKFSKSAGTGVFGNDVQTTGIAADIWRFYLCYNRPEKNDTLFAWKEFQERVNSDLIGNLANLVNRTLTFYTKNFGAEVPAPTEHAELWKAVREGEARIRAHFEKAELRDALKETLDLADLGNKLFQDSEPWKLVKTDPAAAKTLLGNLVHLVRDLGLLIEPYLPATGAKVRKFLGMASDSWTQLGQLAGGLNVGPTEILFKKLEDDEIAKWQAQFAGSQKERRDAMENKPTTEKAPVPAPPVPPEVSFREKLDLRVAKILEVKQHPGADKLYIEVLETAPGVTTQIVSGLAPYYKPEELAGRHILLAANLKPAKLRGEMSNGMLLAASKPIEDGKEIVEVIFADHVAVGTPLDLEGDAPRAIGAELKPQITIDTFFATPLRVEDGILVTGATAIKAGGALLETLKVLNGEVG